MTVAAVTTKPMKVRHQQRVRSPELRGLEDWQAAAFPLQASHALVDQHPGNAALVRDLAPHRQLPEVGALRMLPDEMPAGSHLSQRCDNCEVRERYRDPSRSEPS